jgi:ribosome-associated toxin RatA of RatAB toxin-antitoxin module
LALTFAVPARAAETLTRAEMAALSKGEPVVRVMRDAQSKSVASGQAFSAIDIPTPPEAVFAALTDCARVTRYVKNLVSCKILKHDPMGAWDIRETIMSLSMALPNFRAVARLDYVRPKQIKFQQTEGNFDYAQGQWDLAPFREGKATRVFYRVRAGTSFPVPEFVIQNLIESDLPETLKALRAEAVRGHSAAKR